jgi:ferritin-like metal-binding protein YciE
MKTSEHQYQLLLEQATTLYNSEKELSGIFEALKANTDDASLMKGITLEAEENKRHCSRLEGLIEVLNRTPYKHGNHDEPAQQNFIQQFSMMLKRIAFKHADFGYKTAIFVALALGQNEIASYLRCTLGHGNILFIK